LAGHCWNGRHRPNVRQACQQKSTAEWHWHCEEMQWRRQGPWAAEARVNRRGKNCRYFKLGDQLQDLQYWRTTERIGSAETGNKTLKLHCKHLKRSSLRN
jgi:hypothetical protein